MDTEEALACSLLLKDKKTVDDQEEDERQQTDWKAICLATTLTCLVGGEGLLVSISRWPYLVQSDPEATSQYFGKALSVSKSFHAVFAFVFAYITYRTREIRLPLFIGRLLSISAGLLYLSVELLPYAKREVLVVTYVLHEVADASMTVLRGWIAANSSPNDRTRAFASLILSIWISVMIGPLFQLLFTSLSMPGHELPFGLHLNLYTAPIYLGLILNTLCFPIIWRITRNKSDKSKHCRTSDFTIESIRRRMTAVMKLDINWTLVFLCWIQKMIVILPVVTLMTLMSPILMITQGWDGAKTVAMSSLSTTGVGVISICVTLFFLFCRHSKRIPPAVFYGFGLSVFIVTYFSSFPFENVSSPIPAYNESAGSGCNLSEYSWCSTGRSVSAATFLSSSMVQSGLGLTTAQIALDGVYSRLIGAHDQSILQSVIVVVEDIMFIFGPSVTTSIFAAYGQAVLWIVNGTIITTGLILWICFSRKIKTI